MVAVSPSCSVLALLFAAGVQAFAPAPIRWGGLAGKRLANGLDRFVLATASQPQRLTLREQSGDISPSAVPLFTAQPDNTIRIGHSVCLEASGDTGGDSVRLNRCNGGETQKWNWHPWGPIQLQGTNQCLGVSKNIGVSVDGALVELRLCDNQIAEAWMFEEASPLNRMDPQYPDLFFCLAILYWGGLGAAFCLAMYDKLMINGGHARSQPFVHGARLDAVIAIQPVGDVRAAPPTMVVKESNTRSAAKTIGWRMISGVVTACTSMIFTGNLETAAAIVSWDLCGKSVTFFIAERLWNKVDWGKDEGEDSNKRSLVKALVGRVSSAFITLFNSIVITKGSADIASEIASTDVVIKTLLFFFYERAWAKILWGKQSSEDIGEIRSISAGELGLIPIGETGSKSEPCEVLSKLDSMSQASPTVSLVRMSQEETFRGVLAFLEDAGALHQNWKVQDDDLVTEALMRCADEMEAQAAEIHETVKSVGSELLPLLDDGSKELPQESIAVLNGALQRVLPSTTIPAKLADSKPGDKLFGGLIQKLRKVCSMDKASWKSKLKTSIEEALRNGRRDPELAGTRNKARVQLEEDLWQNTWKHAQALAQSDHQPLYCTVQLRTGNSAEFMSWNVLEFPHLPEGARYAPPEAVIDGIRPTCSALLQILEKKGKDQKKILLQAMTSHHAVVMHFDLIAQEVRHALTEKKVKAVLLQELSASMQAQLAKQAEEFGWHAHFGQANADPKKCDAITAVLSLEAFDEVAEFECLVGNKPRFFAVVRQGSTWVVSCHVPGRFLTKAQKKAQKKAGVVSHGYAANATATVQQIVQRFWAADGDANELVAGGDFNTDVRILRDNLEGNHSFARVDLQAPDGATCLDVEWPIDAILALSGGCKHPEEKIEKQTVSGR